MKTGKRILTVVLILVLLGACIGGFFIWKHQHSVIGKDAALEIALDAAGLTRAQVWDVDVEYDKERGAARYEVDFDGPAGEYEYVLNAATGEILSARPQA